MLQVAHFEGSQLEKRILAAGWLLVCGLPGVLEEVKCGKQELELLHIAYHDQV